MSSKHSAMSEELNRQSFINMVHYYKDIIETVYNTGRFTSKEYRLRVRLKRFKFFKQIRVHNDKPYFLVSKDVCNILGMDYNKQYIVKNGIV